MKESVLYPYPFPCYLVDRETFSDKVKSDANWLRGAVDEPLCERTSDLVQAMQMIIRTTVDNRQRIYFNWSEQVMYVQER